MSDFYRPPYYGGSGSQAYLPGVQTDQTEPQDLPGANESFQSILDSFNGGKALASTPLSTALVQLGLVPTIYSPPNLDPTLPSWVPSYTTQFDATGKPLKTIYQSAPEGYWYTGQDAGHIQDDMVYMGEESAQNVPQAHISIPGVTAEEGGARTQHAAVTVQEALNQPYMWTQDKVEATEKKMREAGLNVTSFDDMLKQWSTLVIRASRTFTLSEGRNAVSPWDMLEATKKENIAAGALDKNGNIVHTSTHTSIYNVSDGDAWASMKAATANLLGRDPTDDEVSDFASRAANVAANHPSTTTTTTTTDVATGQSDSSSTSTNGFDENDLQRMAYNNAQDNPDYGAYQAAATYFNAAMTALPEVAGSTAVT